MYSKRFCLRTIALFLFSIETLLAKEKYVLAAQRLKEKFTALMGAMCQGELLEEAQRTAFVLTPDREAALRDCLSLLRQIQKQLAPHLPQWILYRLGTTEQTLNLFFTGDRKYILYIQYDRDGSPSLCAPPAGKCRNSCATHCGRRKRQRF